MKEDIIIEEFWEIESNQEEEGDKFNRVDLFAENSKGEHIIIEIQNTIHRKIRRFENKVLVLPKVGFCGKRKRKKSASSRRSFGKSLFSIGKVIIFKKTVDNKSTADNPRRKPTQRLDGAGVRQCHRYLQA